MTTLSALGFGDDSSLRPALGRLADMLTPHREPDAVATSPNREELLADIAIWRWGLNERLLDIVENYLGLPARYLDLQVRRETAGDLEVGLRRWHRDSEDRRQLKILIWIRDVAVDGGPYEYIPADVTSGASRQLRYVAGYVPSARLARVVPAGDMRTCEGPAWTVVFTDPARVFHRVSPSVARARYSATYSYTSHHLVKDYVWPVTNEQYSRMSEGLTRRQMSCLPWENR
jgi:hypothetical protein